MPVPDAQGTPDWLKDDAETVPARPTAHDVPVWFVQPTSLPNPLNPPRHRKFLVHSQPVDLPTWLAGLDDEQSNEVPSSASTEEFRLGSRMKLNRKPLSQLNHTTGIPWKLNLKRLNQPKQTSGLFRMAGPRRPKLQPREMSFEVERPRPAKRSVPKPPRPAHKPELGVSLESAQSEMGRGNIGAAMDVYAKLIHKGKSLEEIIRGSA